jgi:hypothetical protein
LSLQTEVLQMTPMRLGSTPDASNALRAAHVAAWR